MGMSHHEREKIRTARDLARLLAKARRLYEEQHGERNDRQTLAERPVSQTETG